MAKPRVPARLRRLTKEEARLLGVSYTAKHRVNADLKRVTKQTRHYTDREVAQSKLGVSKEQATRRRVTTVERRGGGTTVHVANLRKQALMIQLRKLDPNAIVILRIKADRAGYPQANPWSSGMRVRARTLIDPHGFDVYLNENEIISRPEKYGLTVL